MSEKAGLGVSAQLPFVSVVMPVRNEEKAIRHSVGTVLAQDYPRDRMEVIVADGMSTDRTREILREIQEHDSRLQVIDNPGRIMAKGFNAGVKHSRGEVIVMMGGHAEMCPNYVSTTARLLQDGVAECVGGKLETVAEGAQAEAIATGLASRFGVGRASFRLGAAGHKYVETVAFGAYRRDVILNAGLLDEEFVRNQDDEFNNRLRKLGARIMLAPEIHCRYHSRSSLRALWRQYYLYGLWKVRVLQKHPRQMSARQFAPALFVSALALLLPGWALTPAMKWAFVSLAGIYMGASCAASVMVAAKSGRWALLPLFPAVFATLHFSYGTGFLVGLVRFWNRWSIFRAHGPAKAEA